MVVVFCSAAHCLSILMLALGVIVEVQYASLVAGGCVCRVRVRLGLEPWNRVSDSFSRFDGPRLWSARDRATIPCSPSTFDRVKERWWRGGGSERWASSVLKIQNWLVIAA